MEGDQAAPTQQDRDPAGTPGATAMLVGVIGVLLLCVAMALVAWRG